MYTGQTPTVKASDREADQCREVISAFTSNNFSLKKDFSKVSWFIDEGLTKA